MINPSEDKLRSLSLAICAITFTAVGYSASFTGVFNGLYNTGVNSASVVLPGGSIASQYLLLKSPTGCSGVSCVNDANTLFGPDSFTLLDGYPTAGGSPWIANDTTSKWIGPRSDQRTPVVGGSTATTSGIFASDTSPYVYRTVFNLSALGLDPSTAQIQLRWASDSPGAPAGFPSVFSHLRLCGISSANDFNPCSAAFEVANSNSLGFASFKTVNINSGFTSGYMALDFVVYNAVVPTGQNNPSGMRAEILSATADPVPEPASYALMGSALAGLALLRRRK